MAFKASGIIPKDAFDTIRRQALVTKDYFTQRKAQMQQATCSAELVLSIAQSCQAILGIFDTQTAVPGLAQYAKDQVNDVNYDIAAEYTTMRNAIVAMRDAVVTLFPKDGSGFLLYQTLNLDGSLSIRTFTAAQLNSLIALADNIINAIS